MSRRDDPSGAEMAHVSAIVALEGPAVADLTVAQRRVLREIAQALGGLVAEGSIRDAVAERLQVALLVRLDEVRDGECRMWVWHLTDAGRAVYERLESRRG